MKINYIRKQILRSFSLVKFLFLCVLYGKILYNTTSIITTPMILFKLITYYLTGIGIILITTIVIHISGMKNFRLVLGFNRVLLGHLTIKGQRHFPKPILSPHIS